MGQHRNDPTARPPLPWVPVAVDPGRAPSPARPAPPAVRSDLAPAASRPVLPWAPDVAPTALRPAPASRWHTRLDLLVRDRRRLAVLLPVLLAVVLLGVVTVLPVLVALVPGGGATVTTPFLSYTAPAGWAAEPGDAAAPLDAPALTGATRGPGYDCGGERWMRGYTAAALLPADSTSGAGPADRAERLARWFAGVSYGTPGAAPALTVAPPRPVRVPGPAGPVDATVVEVTAAGAPGGCAPGHGTVLVLAAPVSGGAALLLAAGDTDGGPAQPAPPPRATLDAVLASARLTTR